MTPDLDLEKFISEIFANLPRQRLPIGSREEGWLKINRHIRAQKLVARPKTTRIAVWSLFRFRKLAPAILVTAIVLGVVGGASKVSEESLPGETFYPVKKVTETVEKVLATSDEAKIKVGIKHAKRRLEEVKVLVQEKKADEVVVTETLKALKSTTEQIIVTASHSKTELLGSVVNLVTEQERVLGSVKNETFGSLKAVVQEVLESSRESVNKLKVSEEAKPEDVKGVTQEETSKTSATSSLEITPGQRKPKIKDGIIESPIQIHDVISGETSGVLSPPEPEVISEPKIQF